MSNVNVTESTVLSERNPSIVLNDGVLVACEECAPCEIYIEAGYTDADVYWTKCPSCQAEHDAFIRGFWGEKVQWRLNGDITEDNQRTVRINGKHYVIGSEDSTSMIRGFGGSKFKIKFIDGPHAGVELTSTNVWYQGEIDEEFLAELPDNAVFI